MNKIKLVFIYYYNYLSTPKMRLAIRISRVIFTLITLLNSSPDLSMIDYIIKNELEDSEIVKELALTEKQKMWLKIGCVLISVSIFIIYVLKNYHNIGNETGIESLKPLEQSDLSNITEGKVDINTSLNETSLDEYEIKRLHSIFAWLNSNDIDTNSISETGNMQEEKDSNKDEIEKKG